jgi:hypothetical protein
MDEESLSLSAGDLEAELLPRLMGRVFHVTPRTTYPGIVSDGSIKSNQTGCLGFTTSQSEVSYFRTRGCVSLIDLRTTTQEQVNDTLLRYYFLNPFSSPEDNPAFLLLKESESCFEQLIPWSDASVGDMVVPYVEAGYRERIPLSLVERVLLLEITYPLTVWDRFDALLASNVNQDNEDEKGDSNPVIDKALTAQFQGEMGNL